MIRDMLIKLNVEFVLHLNICINYLYTHTYHALN